MGVLHSYKNKNKSKRYLYCVFKKDNPQNYYNILKIRTMYVILYFISFFLEGMDVKVSLVAEVMAGVDGNSYLNMKKVDIVPTFANM